MIENFNKHLGNMLKTRRLALGLTQTKVAKAINVTFQQIQKYDTGANRVSAGRLYLIAQELDISPGWFFEGLQDNQVDSDQAFTSSSRFAIDCVRSLTRLKDDRVRSAIQTMIRTLAEADEEDHADAASNLSGKQSDGMRAE